MTKRLQALLLLLLSACALRAQQLPLFGKLQGSAELVNPAAVSSNYLRFEQNVNLQSTYRNQWTQIEGHPRTAVVTGSWLVGGYEGVSPQLGLQLTHDQTGPTGFTGASAKLAGVLARDPYDAGISLGLQAGFNQYRLNVGELRLRDEETVFLTDDQARVYPDVGVGVFAYKRLEENVYYAGLSSPQLLSLEFSFQGRDGEIVTQRYRHFYAQLGAIVNINPESYWEPTLWIKQTPGVPVDVNGTIRYQSELAIYTGIGASSSKTIHGEVGVTLGQDADKIIRVGYGIDYAFANYGPFVGATHEFQFSYAFNR